VAVNWVSYAQLATDVRGWVSRLPDVDLVVGVPRSGMIPAEMIGLQRNLPVTDLHSFVRGEVGPGGQRCPPVTRAKRVLVVDDSLLTGRSMRSAQEQLGVREGLELHFAAVYGPPEAERSSGVHVCRRLSTPRVFEWNVFHHVVLEHACVDIDGVICRDPAAEENDDGERYRAFIRNVAPNVVPTRPVLAFVTSRLEKYRADTETWLARHGFSYRYLVMLDLPDAQTRRRLGNHGAHKARVYASGPARLFVESERSQAELIQQLTGRPVLCTDSMQMLQGPPSQFQRPGRLSAEPEAGRKLEIGPGDRRIGPGWVTVGALASEHVDHQCRWGEERLPFPDASFDLAYASHVLEHVAWHQTVDALAEVRRVLVPGGRFEVWVPDFERIVAAYLQRRCVDSWRRFNPDGDFMLSVNGRLFTYGPEWENYHRTCFDRRFLGQQLERAGFVDIQPLHTPRGTDHGIINLGMAARRPKRAR